jgi:uncharacterized protein (TIGR00299 family) protein
MKILYFDIVGGIAGDMTVAALIELGVPLAQMQAGLDALGLPGLEIAAEKSSRHHISGTHLQVSWPGMPPVGDHNAGNNADAHSHGEAHGHGHAHSHTHVHRPYGEVRRLLEDSNLPEGARRIALDIFQRLAEAEAEVHNMAIDEVEFHEVGAWDSIADVVCTAVGIDHLAPEAIYCSAVPVGCGEVKTAHGLMPVPAPATLLLLRGFPIVQGPPAFERTTPTGAAILAACTRPAPETLSYVPERVGVGLGTLESEAVPNLLRVVLGHMETGAAGRETIECAEANLDDANPEWIGYLMERLLEAGALDVALLPIQMKKNRPGTQVQVIYPPSLRDAMLELLFSESTTLGVRYHSLERAVLPREEATVNTQWGMVRGKVAQLGGTARFAPEYEACREIARKAGVPLQEVYQAAQAAWRQAGSV